MGVFQSKIVFRHLALLLVAVSPFIPATIAETVMVLTTDGAQLATNYRLMAKTVLNRVRKATEMVAARVMKEA